MLEAKTVYKVPLSSFSVHYCHHQHLQPHSRKFLSRVVPSFKKVMTCTPLLFPLLLLLSLSTTHSIIVRQNGCSINIVCYALDQSGSISRSEYIEEQDFLIGVAAQVETESAVSPFNSAVAFSSSAQVIQTLTSNVTEFEEAIKQPRIFNGGTVISAGLTVCRNQVSKMSGNRVIVLLTDGRGDETASIQVADSAKAEGIDIITVGIGNSVNEDFLRQIATTPEFYLSAEFDVLNQDIPGLVQAICTIPEIADVPDVPEVTTLPSPPVRNACKKAYDECDFMFAGLFRLPKFNISGKADISFTPRIVAKDVMVSIVVLNTNNIPVEFIGSDGSVNAISKFGDQPFTSTVFKPFWIPKDRGSGIGHETFEGNQKSIVGDKCVRVVFTHFQEFRQGSSGNQNNVPRSKNACVVFRTM